MKEYYVYIWFYENEIVYVGKGRGDRWKHGNSGVSSCYGLNAVHHKEGSSLLECVVFKGGFTEKEALKVEAQFIKNISPKFNGTDHKGKNLSISEKDAVRVFNNKCESLFDDKKITKKQMQKAILINNLMIERYSYKAMAENLVSLEGHYKMKGTKYSPIFRLISRRNNESWTCITSSLVIKLWMEIYGFDLRGIK